MPSDALRTHIEDTRFHNAVLVTTVLNNINRFKTNTNCVQNNEDFKQSVKFGDLTFHLRFGTRRLRFRDQM